MDLRAGFEAWVLVGSFTPSSADSSLELWYSFCLLNFFAGGTRARPLLRVSLRF